MHTISISKSEEGSVTEYNSSDEESGHPKTSTQNSKRISFPADSILNAVIQDGDVMELLHILKYRRGEIDLNQKNHTGLTALHYAVLTNNLDSVKLLLTHGANVCSQDEYGFSPLHTAAALGFLQVTTLLIVHGADVFSLTKHSELPVDLAKDISVIRVLSNEMCLKIQSEKYFASLIFLALRKVWSLLIEGKKEVQKCLDSNISSLTENVMDKSCEEIEKSEKVQKLEEEVRSLRRKYRECMIELPDMKRQGNSRQ